MTSKILTTDRMPDNHIPVEVEGGLAYYNGNHWVSSSNGRVIEWPVTWWKAADVEQWYINEYMILSRRINKAHMELESMIDGGEECRGKDSQISYIMQILMGEI